MWGFCWSHGFLFTYDGSCRYMCFGLQKGGVFFFEKEDDFGNTGFFFIAVWFLIKV